MITRCVLPEAGVYEIDGRLILYLTHCHLCNQGRGLREGAEVEIINAHFLKMSTQVYKVIICVHAYTNTHPMHYQTSPYLIAKFDILKVYNFPFFEQKMSGLVCCTLSRIEVVHFSTKDTAFKVCFSTISIVKKIFFSYTGFYSSKQAGGPAEQVQSNGRGLAGSGLSLPPQKVQVSPEATIIVRVGLTGALSYIGRREKRLACW